MTSKLDYLKKYMDNGGSQKPSEKRRKKQKKAKPLNNIRIIDSQATFSTKNDIETDDDNGEFDLMEEKPILYAEDGATIFTKEYEEQEKRKKSSWKTVSKNTQQELKQHDSDGSDYSPPRKLKENKRRQRNDSSGSDLSIPRRPLQGRNSDSDVSPPRKRRTRHDSSASSDLSPKRNHQQPDSDLSPERPNKVSDSDYSPERSSKKEKKRKRKEEIPEVVSIGKRAGLQSASDLKIENDLRRRQEREKFKNMDQDVSGKGAETVYRDRKSGKKIDVKLEALQKRKEEEKKAKEMEKYAVWGRGVAQEKENKQKLEDALHEISKPLARYKDDRDLDEMLKEQDRDGDPMLAYLTKKKKQVDRNKPSKPKYNGPTPAPNRFNIWPGYRYDGVDRSNGFEKKRFATINKMKTFNEAKHKWSVEDM